MFEWTISFYQWNQPYYNLEHFMIAGILANIIVCVFNFMFVAQWREIDCCIECPWVNNECCCRLDIIRFTEILLNVHLLKTRFHIFTATHHVWKQKLLASEYLGWPSIHKSRCMLKFILIVSMSKFEFSNGRNFSWLDSGFSSTILALRDSFLRKVRKM